MKVPEGVSPKSTHGRRAHPPKVELDAMSMVSHDTAHPIESSCSRPPNTGLRVVKFLQDDREPHNAGSERRSHGMNNHDPWSRW